MEFYASCPQGFESALADELRDLGLPRVRKLKGRVSFAGTPEDAERACLWSRLASRIFVVLKRFTCRDADELYDEVYTMPWEDILRRGSTIAITASGTNGNLRNTRFTALRAKDALCDRLADEVGVRADVDTGHPDARISIALHDDRASLQLDLSGEPLFRRLPREIGRQGGSLALRPDYAALVLAQVAWKARCDADDAPVLIDPCCADGGILLEAASIAARRAPGLERARWGFSCWADHDRAAWDRMRSEARQRAQQVGRAHARIIATDFDAAALARTRRLIKTAGADGIVTFVQPTVEAISAHLGSPSDTHVLAANMCTLRLNDASRASRLIQQLAALAPLRCAPVSALSRDGLLEVALRMRPTADIAIKPNNEDARLVLFDRSHGSADAGSDAGADAHPNASTHTSAPVETVATVDVGDGSPVAVLVPESDQFAARLKKVARLRRKWAKREGVTCYRVYDADLPDYSAAIDLYEGAPDTPGRWVVVAEYAAPKSIDPSLAQARLLDMLEITPRVLKVDPDHVAARSRTRSRGGSQYATGGGASSGGSARETGRAQTHQNAWEQGAVHIQEGGLTFTANFNSYLDTGIFLDHRVTRDLVRTYAKGCKRFLNLFAYTGTATCYAAGGGALSTTTVDLSNTYLDWARHNMAQNGFTGPEHRFVRDDVLAWVAEQRRAHRTWDLIFCDPPTFSNSSKMGERTWDVQRDHVELLCALSDLLAPGGRAIFSCNLRTFRLDERALADAGIAVEDITEQTIPEDFARNKRIHRCFIITNR